MNRFARNRRLFDHLFAMGLYVDAVLVDGDPEKIDRLLVSTAPPTINMVRLVSYPSSAPHNSRHGPLVDFVPTSGKLSALAYATVSLFDVDRHWSIGPRQERVDLCHVFPGRHTSSEQRWPPTGGVGGW